MTMQRNAEVPGTAAIPRNVDSATWHLSQIDDMLGVLEEILERGDLPEGAEEVFDAADLGIRASMRAAYRVWSVLNALIQGQSPATDSYMRRMMEDLVAPAATMEAWPEK